MTGLRFAQWVYKMKMRGKRDHCLSSGAPRRVAGRQTFTGHESTRLEGELTVLGALGSWGSKISPMYML